MDFTPAQSEGLDDLKKNIINGHLDQPPIEEPHEDSTHESASLEDMIEPTSGTFSMDDIDVSDVMTQETDDVTPMTDDVDAAASVSENLDTVGVVAPMVASGVVADAQASEDTPADLSKITIDHPTQAPAAPVFSFDEEEDVKQPTLMDRIQKLLHIRVSGSSLTWYVLGVMVFLGAMVAAGYFYYAERYVYYMTQPDGSLSDIEQKALDKIISYRDVINSVGLIDVSNPEATYFDIDPEQDPVTLQGVLQNPALSYVEQYDHFGAYIGLLDRRIPVVYQELIQAREEMASYPFFPSLLQDIIDPENDSSLQRSLLSLEAVKFRTALAVFAKFDTFINDFALISGQDADRVRSFLDTTLARGDRDIDYYLTTCYLNPYELHDQCTQYGDFARMYEVYESRAGTGDKIDTLMFARMMGFIDEKLESSVLPSLALSTRDFDPIGQTLTLEVDVNTLPEDTLQLLKQGILNPHVYVVGHMINFLRQSKFIISKDININELHIDTVTVPVGSKEVTVSTSHFSFTLPLQKNTQREITDYFERREGFDVLDAVGGSDDVQSGAMIEGDALSGTLWDDVQSEDDISLSGTLVQPSDQDDEVVGSGDAMMGSGDDESVEDDRSWIDEEPDMTQDTDF